MRRGVHDLHVVGDDEFFETRGNLFGQSRLEVQKQFVRERKNIQVAFHFTFGRGDRGVTTFARAKFFHVVRDLAVQKSDAIRAGQTNPRAKT